jgi:hypothetical protein
VLALLLLLLLLVLLLPLGWLGQSQAVDQVLYQSWE